MALLQPDKYDLGAVAATVVLLVFAYVVYPSRIVQVSTWLVIFTIYVAWMAIAAYRWTFDTEPQ